MPGVTLLTGASGFIGANLTRRLIHDGVETHVLVRDPGRAWRLRDIAGHLRIHTQPLDDAERLGRLIRDIRPHAVYHLAAEGGYEHLRNSRRAFETNLFGTMNLMDVCAELGSVVFVNAGTSSEYGRSDVPMREDALLKPSSAYAIAKASATYYGQLLARERDLAAITLRIFSAYGPWEAPERFVAKLILRLLDGELPPLVAPGTGRDFIYVGDVVEAFIAAGRRPDLAGEVLNVGTGHQGSIGEVVDIALALTNTSLAPTWQSMPDRCWDSPRWVADPGRAASVLGFRAAHDLRRGLAATLEWFREHRQVYSEVARS